MRTTFLIYLVVSAFLGCPGPVAYADEKTRTWHGLEKMMTAEEYQAAGLGKLSAEELSKLNEWLLHFIAYDSQQVAKSDAAVQELQNAPVRRRIAGTFHGWDGKTIFTLDNGEVWKQRLSGRYFVTLENPEVEIYKNLLGFYELRIVKTGYRVGVSRVK